MFEGILDGDTGEKGSGIEGDHLRVGTQFKVFHFLDKFSRVFTHMGTTFNEGFKDVVEEGGKVFLRGSYVASYETGWVILGGLVSLDGRVSGGC